MPVEPEVLGADALVTVIPPALYPPVAAHSPVAVYAVVEALIEALARYKAAFTVSGVGAVRLPRDVIVAVPSWCIPSHCSDLKLFAIPALFAI
jgi:hypothetical protein